MKTIDFFKSIIYFEISLIVLDVPDIHNEKISTSKIEMLLSDENNKYAESVKLLFRYI